MLYISINCTVDDITPFENKNTMLVSNSNVQAMNITIKTRHCVGYQPCPAYSPWILQLDTPPGYHL